MAQAFWPANQLTSEPRGSASNPVVRPAEFHKVTFFVQPGNGEPMHVRQLPAVRYLFQLCLRITSLHGEQSAAADTQVSGPLHERTDLTDCA